MSLAWTPGYGTKFRHCQVCKVKLTILASLRRYDCSGSNFRGAGARQRKKRKPRQQETKSRLEYGSRWQSGPKPGSVQVR